MSWFIPNEGEIQKVKDTLRSQAIVLFLYKNQVVPDGSMTVASLTKMISGGGEGYAEIPLSNVINESAPATGQWYVSLDANGRASAQYGLAAAPQAWIMNTQDVADGETVFGIGAYTLVLPFASGAKEIKVGDTIKGATSGATGIVTAVEVQSGTWAAGTAAGFLYIMTKTGTFQNSENIGVLGEVGTINATPTAGGTGYSLGDVVEITTGGAKARVVVVAEAGGIVSAVALATGGHGYTTGAGKATTKITGAGNNDLTVNITALASTVYAVTNTGSNGDALMKLWGVEAFSAGTLIDTVGQQVTYLPIFTGSTAP